MVKDGNNDFRSWREREVNENRQQLINKNIMMKEIIISMPFLSQLLRMLEAEYFTVNSVNRIHTYSIAP